MIRRVIFAATVLLAAAASASQPETSSKIDAYTYFEQVNHISVIVSSRLASISRDETHLPFQIAIGVHDNDTELFITRASFLLTDDEGVLHPMAAFADVHHTLVSGITRSAAAWPLNTPNEYLRMEEVLIDFYPEGIRSGTEGFWLARRTYFEDVIFFPQPESDLDGVLSLRFVARGLPEPIEVRFLVPDKKIKKGK
jgi:hypothetical protein